MKAVLCRALGPAANLVVEDLPSPEPGPGEAVVTVRAAGLNFFDTLIIEGKYQFKPDPPFSPAAEFAGTVKAVGPAVDAIRPGDRVMGYCGWGAAREEIAVGGKRACPDSAFDLLRGGGRPHRHLWHDLPCAP